MANKPTIYSVGQINKHIKDKLDKDALLGDVFVRGELSNFKKYPSGHMYFSLKDASGVLSGLMFAGNNWKLKFTPKDGMKVIVRGNISVFERDGKYQIYASDIQPEGVGSLYLAYEQLKEKLDKEGLFSDEHKQPIPTFPKKIAVITSAAGAAKHDIFTTLKRRYPIGEIIFMPVTVQGEPAAPSIVNAIELVNRHGEADVLIVGRGGGSIEDLWAFNEEVVARSIFHSKIPVISAVGHETDFTIADFVADLRAPTPTGAAELATPFTVSDLKKGTIQLKNQMQRALLSSVSEKREMLRHLEKNMQFRHPKKKLDEAMQTVDNLTNRMQISMNRLLKEKNQNLLQMKQRLHVSSPKRQITKSKEEVENLTKLLSMKMNHVLQKKDSQMMTLLAKLDGLSPLKTMSRGYSLTYKENELVKSSKQINVGDEISVRVSDATLTASVNKIQGGK